MMTADLVLIILIMVQLLFDYANLCDFGFTKNEDISFSRMTPFMLNCDPVYEVEREMCVDNQVLYKWFHENQEIVMSRGKAKFVSSNQRLIVFAGDRSDEGVYLCDSNNDNGPINKTFRVRMTDPSVMQKLLLPNAFPQNQSLEENGRIYWLPEMLLNHREQSLVKNPGENLELTGFYYVSAESSQIDKMIFRWYFHTELFNYSQNESLEERAKNFNSSCNDLDFMPRSVTGSCYSSRLHLNNLSTKYQGYYTCDAQLRLKNGLSHSLNLTYRININMIPILEQGNNREPQMTFTQDSSVCQDDYFHFICKVNPEGSYFTTISKINPNKTHTLLVESKVDKVKFIDEKKRKVAEGMTIINSQVNYLIKSVQMNDSGEYLCQTVEYGSAKDVQMHPSAVEQMRLTVKSCETRFKYPTILWTLISIGSFIFVLVLVAMVYLIYIKYSSSYLIKTVIVQHPNKLYVPHDSCLPLIIPEVSIKTTRKRRIGSDDSLLQQKHLNRISNVPFSQKISKYLRKSIFNYRHVDNSGSNPEAQLVALSSTENNKVPSNSLSTEAPRSQLILQNDAQTKYILPSNIGWIFSRDSLIIGSKIGEGAFGIVYSALVKSFSDDSTHVEVAIKTLHTSFGDEDVINLIKELEMMKVIGHHRHIIALYGACVDNGYPYMVIELAKNGNLRDFLRARRNHFTNVDSQKLVVPLLTVDDLIRFSIQIAEGMNFLSSKNIVHRDLAARNVLVDHYLEMKIADFGLTRSVEHYYRKTTDGRLPIKWMAPECLFDRMYTVKSDVWSFSIVLWEIFTLGQTPYPTIQSDSMHQALRNGVRNERPALGSEEIYRLMLYNWNDDPLDRNTFSELVDKLTHIQITEGCTFTPRDYLEISSNQCYSTTNV